MDLSKGDTRLIINVCAANGLLRNQCAYVLATAYHETAHTMKPVRETLAKTDAGAIAALTKAWKSGKLSWVKKDYWSSGFFGRGYVQLTHEANYRYAGEQLGLGLVARPSLALEADVAAEVIVRGMKEGWFTGKKLSDYITLNASHFVAARRIVNGTDRAAMIADYAIEYDADLKAEGYGASNPEPKPVQSGIPSEPGVVVIKDNTPVKWSKNGWLAALIDIFLAIFSRSKR